MWQCVRCADLSHRFRFISASGKAARHAITRKRYALVQRCIVHLGGDGARRGWRHVQSTSDCAEGTGDSFGACSPREFLGLAPPVFRTHCRVQICPHAGRVPGVERALLSDNVRECRHVSRSGTLFCRFVSAAEKAARHPVTRKRCERLPWGMGLCCCCSCRAAGVFVQVLQGMAHVYTPEVSNACEHGDC